ncbi:MAG: hypothetical protein ACYTG5_05325 [Planctomycetota bacterium]
MNSRKNAESSHGYSLIELVITMSLILMLAFLVLSMSITGTRAQKYAERMTRVTEITQQLLDEMQTDLQSSVRLFHNDAIGTAYTALLDLSTLPTPSSALLPTLDPAGVFEPDVVGSEKTGTAMLFARHAWTDEFQVTSGNSYRVDIYRLQGYYMSQEDGGPQPGSATGMNLVRFTSEPLADGNQIERISDPTDRIEFLQHLLNQTPDLFGDVHDRTQVAWKVGQDPADTDTLRQIMSDGSLSDSSVAPRTAGTWQIHPDPAQTSGSMLFYRHHSVATNYAPGVMGVGSYGIIDNTGDGFPHGFEVQIIGPAAARQILLHLTLVSTNRNGRQAYHDLQVIGDTRDL